MSALFYCIIVAALWGSWQLFARASGVPPLAMALTVSAIGLIPITIANIATKTNPFAMDLKQFGYVTLAGFAIGGGTAVYSFLIMNREWDLSIYVPLATVLIAVVVIAGSVFFFGESFNTRKVIGIGFALVALWFLN